MGYRHVIVVITLLQSFANPFSPGGRQEASPALGAVGLLITILAQALVLSGKSLSSQAQKTSQTWSRGQDKVLPSHAPGALQVT